MRLPWKKVGHRSHAKITLGCSEMITIYAAKHIHCQSETHFETSYQTRWPCEGGRVLHCWSPVVICVAKGASLEKHDELPCRDAFKLDRGLKERLTRQEFHNNSNISLALKEEVRRQLRPLSPQQTLKTLQINRRDFGLSWFGETAEGSQSYLGCTCLSSHVTRDSWTFVDRLTAVLAVGQSGRDWFDSSIFDTALLLVASSKVLLKHVRC